jgi:hypothetical protein
LRFVLTVSITGERYFQSIKRLNITRSFLYDAAVRRRYSPLFPWHRLGLPTTTEQGNRTMRISEKAIALLLAVAMSGAAFQTFIV